MSRFRLYWLALELGSDALTFAASFLLAAAVYAAAAPTSFMMAPAWPCVAAALLLHVLLSASLGAYAREKQLLDIASLRGALIATLLGWMGTSTLLWILREPSASSAASAWPVLAEWRDSLSRALHLERFSRLQWSLHYLFLWPLTVLVRRVLFSLLRSAFRRGLGDVRTALYGSEESVRRLRRRLQRAPSVGTRLVGCLTPEVEPEGGPPRLGAPAEFMTIVHREALQRVWVAGDPRLDLALLELGAQAAQASAGMCQVYFALESLPGFVRLHSAAGEWLAPAALGTRSLSSRAMKRTLDIAIALPCLLLSLPLLAILALAVRCDSKGAALVTQRRAGLGARPFAMWKLRTMHTADLPGGGQRKLEHDPRVTRVGRWLRRFSLDELPQLWNILRGDMSLVGPRPEVWAVAAQYDARLRERLLIKPGLTGLWQVSPARHRPIHEELDYDLCYLRAQGLWMDITILLLTPWAVLWGSGAR